MSQSELKRLRQGKRSAGWTVGAAALALAWIFSAFGMSPSQLDFGTLQAGSGGRLPVQLTNRGMTEFHLASIALDGADAKDFGVDPQQSCLTVRSGETCVLWVEFRPRQAGEKHARLIVRASDESEFSSEFKGVAATGVASVTPPPDSPPQVPTPAPTPDAPKPPPASALQDNPPPLVNPPVQPPPTAVPPYVESPQQNSPVGPPPPRNPRPEPPLYAHVTMTPAVTQFSGITPATETETSSAHPITVISDGSEDVRQLSLKVGTPGGPFSYTPGCPIYLARGQRCTVQVHFAASDLQPHADSLSAYDGGARIATVLLRGSGTVSQPPVGHPHLTFRPGEVQFPVSHSDGWVTVNEEVLVVSDGTDDVQQFGLKITPTASPFEYSGNCPTHLARQQTCTLRLTFQQKSQQAFTATIAAYDGSAALASLPLRGGGNAPQNGHPHVTMSPTALRFSGTSLYKSVYIPSQRSVEVRNDGPVDLRTLNLRVEPGGAPFNYTNCPRILARGQTCTTQVTFTSVNGQQSSAALSAFEGVAQLASVQLYGAGSNRPPRPPGASVTGVVDGARPGAAVPPAKGSGIGKIVGAQAGSMQGGVSRGANPAPNSGTQSSNAGVRKFSPNRAAVKMEPQLPPPKPAPVRRAPAKQSTSDLH